MNSVLWIAQILLAGVFLYAGLSKIFAYGRQTKTLSRPIGGCAGLPHELVAAIALAEIAGALAVVVPVDLWPPDILLRLAVTGLALLTVAAVVYHVRRKEPTAPLVALFLLALFIIVGRWPR
jgi:uncharacterized membrane protein YphA (DoxX/SURF4 family)